MSKLWVKADSQAELIWGTVLTLGILILLAFTGMLLFTRSLALSFGVVLATLLVVAGLAFFTTVIAGWPLGLLEVIAVVYFIGYAVTYSLHIAHKYAGHGFVFSDDLDSVVKTLTGDSGALPDSAKKAGTKAAMRFRRTEYAMQSIGCATISSAVTTAGSAFFLVFCTLTIFKKLCGMCLAVTVLSLFVALVPLPAGLLTVGPTRPGVCDLGRGAGPNFCVRLVVGRIKCEEVRSMCKRGFVDCVTHFRSCCSRSVRRSSATD